MDINISFSRSLLGTVIQEVKSVLPGCDVKQAWVYRCGRQQYEFHFGRGDTKFYDGTIRATNAYEARAKGWASYLRHMKIAA